MSVLLCEVLKIISDLRGGSNYSWLAGELFAACHRPQERSLMEARRPERTVVEIVPKQRR